MGKLDVLIKDFNKQYKENIASRGIARVDVKRIPFSSPRANYMLYGGIPRGRIVEFAGEENGGKTTTALDVVANAQQLFTQEFEDEVQELEAIDKRKKEQQTRLDYLKQRGPKQVVYADCENTLDEDWAILLGVDVDSLWILKPETQSAEQIFQMLLDTIETDEVGLIVIDSLGVMLSAQAFEKTMEDKTYAGISQSLTTFSKKGELFCKKFNCTIIGINQMRDNLNSPHGGQVTTGGKAWKHNCSVRLMFSKGSYIDARNNELKQSAESPAGNLVMISIAKTKVCKPDRKSGSYTLKYDFGIDVVADTVDLCVKYGYIVASGSWFDIFEDPEAGVLLTDENGEGYKFQGRANLIEFMANNDEVFDFLYEKITEKLSK